MDGVKEIPGFYFDTEKKKYFRIQPNHIAPGAKHSVQNVRRERRETKRRKISERRTQNLERDCIKRPPVLRNPLTAAGLLRECGYSQPSQLRRAQGMTLTSDLEKDFSLDLGACTGCGQVNTCYDFVSLHGGRTLACSAGATAAIVSTWDVTKRADEGVTPRCNARYGVLDSTGTSLSGNSSNLLVATASISHGPNVLIARAVAPDEASDISDDEDDDLHPMALHLTLGDATTELTGSATQDSPSPSSKAVVVSTRADRSGEAHLLDLWRGQVAGGLSVRDQAFRSTDWLDTNTAVIGARSGAVMLWDTRSQGSTVRWKHPSHAKQVCAAGDGGGVWVASTGMVRKYDTRMAGGGRGGNSAPVCSIRSENFSADMQIAVWKETGTVAVAGERYAVELFDERSGARHGSGPAIEADRERYRVGRIRTGTDYDGNLCLFYALGTKVHKYVF
ncbi:hypothetical protein K461DRAFT_290967 [Myriangium duriaei CBS 260.36]|uniref:Uncharacterized protein n=1 Tax=Myriangium duriaei CBS 260.36 TaxID=1168546 RepID=A0A9P4J9N1_9PEZI|nr:hypothetical protein K461DRAFT_290967 [Myriangium duriaei CBS 260.36]